MLIVCSTVACEDVTEFPVVYERNVYIVEVGGRAINGVIHATFVRCRRGVLLITEFKMGRRSGHENGGRWSSDNNTC